MIVWADNSTRVTGYLWLLREPFTVKILASAEEENPPIRPGPGLSSGCSGMIVALGGRWQTGGSKAIFYNIGWGCAMRTVESAETTETTTPCTGSANHVHICSLYLSQAQHNEHRNSALVTPVASSVASAPADTNNNDNQHRNLESFEPPIGQRYETRTKCKFYTFAKAKKKKKNNILQHEFRRTRVSGTGLNESE